MAKDYASTAKAIVKLIGGEKNVTHFEHCSTRLRFTVTDPAKVDRDGLKATPGVMSLIGSGNQCQVVIGNDVIEVYDEIMKLGNFNNGGSAPAAVGGKGSIGATILDFMVGIFQPLVPAIAGAGILKAILTLCTTFGWLTSDAAIYKVFYNVADAALYFLPVMVAVTTATKFNCNKLVAVATVGAMIMPATTSLLATEGGAFLFGLQLQNIAYTYQVFPAILTVIFLAYLEKIVTKISPKPIRVFFVPLVCFLITFPVALLVLGPLGYNVGTLLTSVILSLYSALGWLAVALLAAILPIMISMGMHKALVPYAVSAIAEMGEEMLYMPASLAHNIAEGGACFAVAVKTKNEEMRSTAISAGISAIFGITEPALYGVTLQNKKVLYGVIGGSFIGGLFIGLVGLKAFVAMGPGLAGMAMFVDPNNSMNIVWAFAGFALSLIAPFVLTFIMYKDADVVDSKAPALEGESKGVISPLNGKLVELSEVPDEVFSAGILGDGVAIIPEKGELYAPCNATVDTVFESNHAITLVGENGAEILLHVGLDTVKLEGKHFEPQVKAGDKVKAGDLLMKFDIKAIKKAGYNVVTPVIVTNSAEYKLTKATAGSVKSGAVIMGLATRK